MEESNQYCQCSVLYYFKKGRNIAKTHKKNCAVYRESAITDPTCQKWFAEFHAGDFSLDDVPQLGRPIEIDNNQIEILIENNQCYTMQEITNILKISKSSVENYLHQLDYVINNHFDIWVPHKLSKKKKNPVSISVCHSLLKHNEKHSVFKTVL